MPVIYLMDILNPFHGQLHLLTSLFCVMQETTKSDIIYPWDKVRIILTWLSGKRGVKLS